MKKTIILIFVGLLMCALSVSAQKKTTAGATAKKGHKIEVLIHGIQSADTLFLQAGEGDKVFIVDTAVVAANGKAIFAKDTPLPVGMYNMVLKTTGQPLDFFFVISAGEPQHFQITYTPGEGWASVHFEGSPENHTLVNYMRYMIQQQQHREDPDQMKHLQAEMKAQRIAIEKDYKGKMLALFVTSIQEPEPKPFPHPGPALNAGELEREYYYRFFRDHFFDNYDFSSPYILRMPFYGRSLGTYIVRIVRPEKDEMKLAVDNLVKKIEKNEDVYRYTVDKFYQMLREAPFPELNELAGYVGDTYIVNRPEMWNDPDYVAKVAERLAKAKLNPVGSIAADLKLQDLSGNWISLHDVQAPFTVLYFFNPLCHTCVVVTPLVYELFKQYRSKGLQVFAIFVDNRREEWEPYIIQNGFLDWINVWDPENGAAGIHDKYDVTAIPTIYLLDRDKKVIAKDIFVDELQMWVQQVFQMQEQVIK